ncbi:hypothetical protein V6N13_047371 [Hibiscus sabdariffa]
MLTSSGGSESRIDRFKAGLTEAGATVAGIRHRRRVGSTRGRPGPRNAPKDGNRFKISQKHQNQTYLGEVRRQTRRKTGETESLGVSPAKGQSTVNGRRKGAARSALARGNCWQPQLGERASDGRRNVQKQRVSGGTLGGSSRRTAGR